MRERIVYIDVLNIIACISVIALHHNTLVHTFEPTAAWVQALGVEVICYFAVPVFFMISGALQLEYDRKYNITSFFRQRVKRILLPFLFWSLLWGCCSKELFKITGLHDFINAVLSSRFCGVYWFFMPLFMLYILVPCMASCVKDKNRHIFYIVATFILGSVLPLLNSICNINSSIFTNNSCMYVCMYALIGYYIHKYNISRRNEFIIHLISVLLIVTRFVYTYYSSYELGITDRFLFNYIYPTAVFPSISVFLIIKKTECLSLSETLCKKLRKIASCSFGIYLIHPIFVSSLWPRLLSYVNIGIDSFVYRVILIPITYLLCFVIVYVSKKNKYLNYILP